MAIDYTVSGPFKIDAWEKGRIEIFNEAGNSDVRQNNEMHRSRKCRAGSDFAGWAAHIVIPLRFGTLNAGPVISNVMQHHRFCPACDIELIRLIETGVPNHCDYCLACSQVWTRCE